ncbi:MAG: ABC transporter substrate-binding protein [Gammaproteobacteria bacterium]
MKLAQLPPVAGTTLWSMLAAAVVAFGAMAHAETVLKVIPHADLKNLDPIWTTAYITRNHGYLIYDTLFAMDEELKPQPQMVEKWQVSGDKLTYTFTLRDGLKWHDGAPVKAEDCVASLQRWGKRDGMGQRLMGFIASLTPVDDKTFKMVLKEPYGLVLESIGKLSSNVPFMMPMRLAATDPFKQVPETIGSGPFKFVKDEWVPGSKVVYMKNADYVPRKELPSAAAGGKIAKVDKIEWLYIPDQQTAMNALISGEVDYFENPQHDLVPILKQTPGIVVEQLDPLGNQGMLRMNHLLPPFDKPEVRQAVLHLIDQKTYLQAAVGNPEYYKVCYSLFACGTTFATEEGYDEYKKRNLEKAKALIKQAGYEGYKVVIMQPTDIPITSAASLVTAQNLREAGFTVEVQAMDWSTLTSRRSKKDPVDQGGWNIFHTWWIGGDISNPISHAGLSGGGPDKAWFGWPSDPKIEELRDAFAKETDLDKRKALAAEIQARALAIGTHGNFGTWFNPVAYRDNIQGVIKSPVQFFWNIEKK